MRLLATIVPVSLSFGIACLVGCSAEHVTAVDETEALVSEGQTDPDDPWGVCDVDWSCSEPTAGCWGWVETSQCESDAECVVDRVRVSCAHLCETDEDCPVPLSGDAAPTCSNRICHLACDDDVTCPNGFSCVPSHDDTQPGSECMQTYGPEASATSPRPVED